MEDLSVSVSNIVDLTATLSVTRGDLPDILPISGHGLFIPKVNPTIALPMPGGETPEISPVSGPHIPAVDVDDGKPPGLSSYAVDPTAAQVELEINPIHYGGGCYRCCEMMYGVPLYLLLACSLSNKQAMANRRTIESLRPQIKDLAESLSARR